MWKGQGREDVSGRASYDAGEIGEALGAPDNECVGDVRRRGVTEEIDLAWDGAQRTEDCVGDLGRRGEQGGEKGEGRE